MFHVMIEPTCSKESSFLDCRFPVIMYLGLADQLSGTKQQNPQWKNSIFNFLSQVYFDDIDIMI